jgi:hypothetical protein
LQLNTDALIRVNFLITAGKFTVNLKEIPLWLNIYGSLLLNENTHVWNKGDRDCMVVGFTTTYAINAYHH